MTDKQQEAIAMLNDMYCSQSKDFQFRYKKNYFALVEGARQPIPRKSRILPRNNELI